MYVPRLATLVHAYAILPAHLPSYMLSTLSFSIGVGKSEVPVMS